MYSLTVNQLSKTYNNSTIALTDVSFEVRPGEIVVLLGPNGSGKSTLFRTIVGLEQATSGSIVIDGKNIKHLSREHLRNLRTHVGLMFQKFNLVENLSVFHNVLLGAMGRRQSFLNWWPLTATESERSRAMSCLERVQLAHLADRRADALSGGQQQRVALARILMQDPHIILADEPVASLDPKAGQEVMDLLWDIVRERGITVICTLHQLTYAVEYADRFIGLRNGRLVIDATSQSVGQEQLQQLYHADDHSFEPIIERYDQVTVGG
jgi:phosphonate transport system ATP-binding protein